MEAIKSVIGILAYASLGFSAAAAYLKLNKVWKRKHNAEVANSVSIAGNVIDIIPLTFFALNFMIVAQWQGLIDSMIWIITGIAFVFIGSGLWVEGKRQKSFWLRVKEALKLESTEIGELASALFRSSNAEIILDVLTQFAYIDRKLGIREKKFIRTFADNWRLEINWDEFEKLASLEQPERFVKARETVARYLKTSPPDEQVVQLIDVLQALIRVDESLSAQEALMMEEVRGQLLDYHSNTIVKPNFSVIIAPQSQEQDAAIAALLPNVEKVEVAGGIGYAVGSYYSHDYAAVICDQYRALGFFTIELMQPRPAV
jgi:hypothetical protein